VDYTLGELLQLVARACPADATGEKSTVAVFCHDMKKDHLRNSLYHPCPVESALPAALPTLLLAALANGAVKTLAEVARRLLPATLLGWRLEENPVRGRPMPS
jgi:hypothetical protein